MRSWVLHKALSSKLILLKRGHTKQDRLSNSYRRKLLSLHPAYRTLFGGRPTQPMYDLAPRAIFSQPPVASCGLTEPQAQLCNIIQRPFSET
eukprot:4394418-Amphidinium_carterae.1